MPVPPYSKSDWPRSAVAWFKDDAPAISRMWQIVGLLRDHGVPVRMLRSKHPGRVLYEDQYQVVVDEFTEI